MIRWLSSTGRNAPTTSSPIWTGIWPPEITRSFQENQQAIVTGVKTPEEAAESIQAELEQLYADGYEFEV